MARKAPDTKLNLTLIADFRDIFGDPEIESS
jgi:hypothetical protein